MVSILSPLAVVGFLDLDYHYKTVASQISHNAGLAFIHPAGIKLRTVTCMVVTLLLCHCSRWKYVYFCKFLFNFFQKLNFESDSTEELLKVYRFWSPANPTFLSHVIFKITVSFDKKKNIKPSPKVYLIYFSFYLLSHFKLIIGRCHINK